MPIAIYCVNMLIWDRPVSAGLDAGIKMAFIAVEDSTLHRVEEYFG
jgi:hypothetical protein